MQPDTEPNPIRDEHDATREGYAGSTQANRGARGLEADDATDDVTPSGGGNPANTMADAHLTD